MKKILTLIEKNCVLIAVLLICFQIVLLSVVQFTAWPEMTLWPYLILNGWKPYQGIAIAHTPVLIFELTALFRIVGVGIIQLKSFTWVYILSTDILLYWVVKKLYGRSKALISLSAFIILSITYQINGMWFDLALVPLAILIFYFLKTKKYLWVGIAWTIAFFTKQTAFWFLVPMGIQLLADSKKDAKELWYKTEFILLGFLATSLVLLLILSLLKVVPAFLSWTVSFGIFYLPKATGQVLLPTIKQLLVAGFPFVILFSYVFFFKKKTDIPLIFWSVFAALGVYPRWELFHFLPALPFIAILISEVFSFRDVKNKKLFLGLGAVFVLGIGVLFGKYLSSNWTREVRFYEPSFQTLSDDIKSQAKGKSIFVVNYWDSLYAFSGTIPAIKPWIPYLPWYLEYKNNKAEIVRELKVASPDIIVVGQYSLSGLGSYQLPELDTFISRYYYLEKEVGGVGIYMKSK